MPQQTLQTFTYGRAVTKSNTVDIPLYLNRTVDALWVGAAGDVAVVFQDSSVVTYGCAIGLLPLTGIKRVNSTGTSATGIVALWQI